MKWFRMDAQAVHHPKVSGLSDKDFRLWMELLSIAARNDGLIPPLVACKNQLSGRIDANYSAISRLVVAGLMVNCGDGFRPHDWADYQCKSYSSAARMRKLRGKSDVTVTPYNTNTNTISSLRSDIPRVKRAPASGGFDRFLSVYPKRINKKAALARWQTAVKAGADPERVIAGAAAYAEWVTASGTEPKFVKAPDAWLNAGKWDDELPEVGKPNGGPPPSDKRSRDLAAYEAMKARVEREAAAEHDDERENSQADDNQGLLGADADAEFRPAGRHGHGRPFGRGTSGLRREGIEGCGLAYFADPEISDLADGRRNNRGD